MPSSLSVGARAPRRAGPAAAICSLFVLFLSASGITRGGNVRMAGPLSGDLRGGTVTVLDDGRILVYGGGSASIWDPERRQWALPGDAARQPRRYLHTATRIGSERIVLVGGLDTYGNRWNQQTALSSVTIWRPGQDIWAPGPGLLAPRFAHAAVALPGGDVLVMGGTSTANHDEPFGPFLATVELLGDKTTTARAPMHTARVHHTATMLQDGRVMVIGGTADDRSALASVEIYDPKADTWQQGPSLAAARTGHTASLLADGRVIVAGGTDSDGNPIARTEIWSRDFGQWSAAGQLFAPRSEHVASVLKDGAVLLSGGVVRDHQPARALELWRPATNAWELAGEVSLEMRDHQAAPLSDGSVLLFGSDSYVRFVALVWLPDEPEDLHLDSVNGASITELGDGRFLLAGGSRRQSASASATLYDVRTNRWTSAAPMHFARSGHRAVRLADGRVLVAGGQVADGGRRNPRYADDDRHEPNRALGETWDPRANRWSLTDDVGEPAVAPVAPAPNDVPQSVGPVETYPLQDGGVLAWKRPHDAQESAQPMLRRRDTGAWDPLPAPTELTARDSLRAMTLADGSLLLVINGQTTMLWLENEHKWASIAHDTRWASLLGIVNALDGRTLAFRSADLPGRPFQRLEAVWLNIPAKRWQPNTNGFVERESPAMLALSDDQIMVAGGATAVVQIWNASTGKWRYTGWLPAPLKSPAILKLADGGVIVAGRIMGDEPAVVCALWSPDTEHWSPCGQFATDSIGDHKAPVLKDLGGGQTLLVYGNARALVRAPDGTWVATRLDFPKGDSVPYPSNDGTAYTTDIGAVWNPSESHWMDATDVLMIHRQSMQGVLASDGRWLFATRGTVLQWQPSERLFSRLPLDRAPESNFDRVMPLDNGCAVVWNNTRELSNTYGTGGYVPAMYVRNFTAGKWSSGIDAPAAPVNASAIVLRDNTLLLAGASRDDVAGGGEWQSYRATCDEVVSQKAVRSLYLPTRRPAASGAPKTTPTSNIVPAQPHPQSTYWETWKATVVRVMDATRQHVQGTLVFGGLFLLILFRFADRWDVYQVDEDGRMPGRIVDLIIFSVAFCALILVLGAPWPGPRTAVLAICALLTMFAAKRLWKNIPATRQKVLYGVPLATCAVLCAVALGNIITSGLYQIIDSLRDY